MRDRLLFLVFVLLLLPLAAFAQVPCETDISQATVINPTDAVAQLLEYDVKTFDGAYLVPTYKLEVFAEGAVAPTTVISLPREAWTLMPGSGGETGVTACYRAKLPSAPFNPWMKYDAVLKAVDATGVESGPSNRAGPFGWAAPPKAPPVFRLWR